MSTDDETLEEIRQRKKQQLQDQLDGGTAAADRGDDAAPSEPIPVEGADHLQDVVADNDVVLVDFYADWCGPCKMIEPYVESVAAETDAAVAKVDIDRHQAIATRQGVQGVPTLLVYADGEPVERMVGAQDGGRLKQVVEGYT